MKKYIVFDPKTFEMFVYVLKLGHIPISYNSTIDSLDSTQRNMLDNAFIYYKILEHNGFTFEGVKGYEE